MYPVANGLTEQIDDAIMGVATGSYSLGLIGDANRRWLLENCGNVVRLVRVYRLGDTLELRTPIKPEHRDEFRTLIEALKGCEDYPVIDDQTYSEVCFEAEDDAIREFANEYRLDVNITLATFRDEDVYLEESDGGMWIPFDEDETLRIVTKIRERSQTWLGHVYGGDYHEPTVCLWCLNNEEGK